MVKIEENDVIKKEKNTNKKKKIIIFIVILAIIITCIGGFTIYKYISKVKFEQEQAEKELNEKLDKCYVAINDNYDFNEFKRILSTIKEKNDKSKAYNKLAEALDDVINNLYNNYNVGNSLNLYKFFKTMMEDKTTDPELAQIIENKNKYRTYTEYVVIAEQNIKKEKYHEAYIAYSSAIRDITGIDKEKSDAIVQKRNEIKEKASESLKNELAHYISEQNYTNYYSTYENFIKNSENEELKNIYNQYLAEQRAAKEAKQKEKSKSQGVYIGMTKQQVLDSMWGEPIKINTTTTKYGVSEQWVYPNNNYLYFENGKLTAIQN